MSALPKNVRAQVERANKLAQEFSQAARGEQPVAPAPPPVTPVPDGGSDLRVNPTPSPTPPEPVPPAPGTASLTPAPVTPLPEPDWKQKYNVLQGKYNAEVPRLQNTSREQASQIAELRDQLTSTQRLLASLAEQRPAASVSPTQVTPPAPTKLVKDEEVREYGADLIDVVRRVAREEHATLLPEIERRVAPVAQRANQAAQAAEQAGARVATNDRQAVLNLLSSEVPEWLEQNSDAGFNEWLAQRDPYAGVARGALLRQAFEANDGPRVVAFFKGYLNEHAVVTPTPAPAPAAAAPAAPQRKLEQLVTPGAAPKAPTTGTQDGSGKRVWTRAEIRQFYAETGNGSFKGTAAERRAIEKDIFLAQSENRIR